MFEFLTTIRQVYDLKLFTEEECIEIGKQFLEAYNMIDEKCVKPCKYLKICREWDHSRICGYTQGKIDCRFDGHWHIAQARCKFYEEEKFYWYTIVLEDPEHGSTYPLTQREWPSYHEANEALKKSFVDNGYVKVVERRERKVE